MRIIFLSVGKIKERGIRDAIDDYVGRIRRYLPVDEIELRDGPNVEKDMRARIPEGAHLVALEVLGKQETSEGFAQVIARQGSRGKGVILFAIGGADGLPAAISQTASATLSLSRMTLPHRLAKLFLAEQVYRAMTILRGEPYPR